MRPSNTVRTVWDAEAIDTSHLRLPANPENCYHPRQFGVQLGNPDSSKPGGLHKKIITLWTLGSRYMRLSERAVYRRARAVYRRFRNEAAAQSGRDFAKSSLSLPLRQTISKPDENPLRAYFNAHHQGPGVWKWDHYFDIYHRHFSKFRGRKMTVLEIGIYSGGSLPMWREYFGTGCTIYGVDIQSECLAYENAFTHVLIGDQADPRFWAKVTQSLPRLDVIIDDGGHTYAQQKTTLECLLPHMSPGGVYVCEDVHGEGNRFAAFSFGIVDELNNAQQMASNEDPERRLVLKTVGLQAAIKAICFYPFIVTIELEDAAVSQLIAPKRGTQWQPFLT